MIEALGHELIGRAGSRWEIPTPALILDLDALDRNIDQMAAHCKRAGIGLRPHAKTHKCAAIAWRQLEAGAVGICCAKLAEAEALAAAGVDAILLTSPVVTSASIERVYALNAQIKELMVVVDNASVVSVLAAAGSTGAPLNVLVDVDVGLHRTGIAPDAAVGLAEMVNQFEALTFRGLQGYAGHLMHVEGFEDRSEKSLASIAMLANIEKELADLDIDCEIVTGGGTGSFNIDPQAGALTDLQGGSYIFMDRQYQDVRIANDAPLPFEASLFVQTSVISNNTSGIVTTDAGFKSFSTDADPPIITGGAPEAATYFFFGDEQGGVFLPKGQNPLALGAAVTCVTPHCDPTVNLYDHYYCVRGDDLVDIWLIEARGRSQ